MASSLKIEAGWRPLSGSEARSAGDNGTITSLLSPPAALGVAGTTQPLRGDTPMWCASVTRASAVCFSIFRFFLLNLDNESARGVSPLYDLAVLCGAVPSHAVVHQSREEIGKKKSCIRTGVLKRAEGWLGQESPGSAGSEHSLTGRGLG